MAFTADPYFNTDSRKWQPLSFGSTYLHSHPDSLQEEILDKYIKSLRYISNDSETTDRRRKKAAHLLKGYQEGDHVKNSLKWLWESAQRGGSPLVINNSTVGLVNTGSIENNGTLGVGIREHLGEDGEGVDGGGNAEGPRKRQRKTSSQDPLEAFTCTYKRMDPHSMWKLSNGTIVERRIYEGVTASPSVEGLLAHIWIISSKDLWMKKLFTDEEWEEMHSSRIVQEATESTRSCWDLLSRFKDVATIDELEAILFNDELEEGIHAEWIYNVMRQMRVLLKHCRAPLLLDHGESWYEVNVWGPIIDYLFLLAAPDIEISRGEVACAATTLRLNEGRTRTGKGHYRATGSRSDAIIVATGSDSPLEYGAMEAKSGFTDETSTAFLNDYGKLMTTLSHILSRLVQSVGAADVKKLQVVGVILAGLHSQVIRMWTPNGNVYVVKTDGLYKVPTNVQRLKDIIPQLFSIWQMGQTVVGCLEVVNNSDRYGSMSLSDFM